MAAMDKELLAMQHIKKVLDNLTPPQRARVVHWAAQKLSEEQDERFFKKSTERLDQAPAGVAPS